MKELALHLVKSLVDQPDKVELTVHEEGDSVTLAFRVAEEDKGKIIGKQGKVIKAVRAVISIAAAKADKKVVVDLE
ncbi:MAG: KH domain-containing protein [Elusimicrobia bacterium]|nr:KH domain-containing protein [Elusimicrobiota bacterium]